MIKLAVHKVKRFEDKTKTILHLYNFFTMFVTKQRELYALFPARRNAMKRKKIEFYVEEYRYEELNDTYRKLIAAAKEASKHSYAPYSHFSVGAAALLDDGNIVSGNNQENAAYPSGLCAERVTLFYANARYPEQAIEAIAITARDQAGETIAPVTPCGACRQVLLEAEQRYQKDICVLLCGKEKVLLVRSTKDLLPLSFGNEFLK